MEVERVEEVRRKFFLELENGEKLQEFHDEDINRLKIDNIWIRCFVRARDNDVEKALDALVECLKWRNAFGLNDLTERLIDRRLFEAGFLYPHNQDKEGNSIVNFVGRLYKKNPEQHPEVKKMLVFLVEKHARYYPGRKMTLIFDMQETGLANMDMDFIKFVINCFTTYFPNTLAWLIVLEMPWILSAAWKVVKSWLSPKAVRKIRFLNKTELLEYVSEENLLVSMGGTDSFEYSYPPKDSSMGFTPPDPGGTLKEQAPAAAADQNSEDNVELMCSFERDSEPAPTSTKKVKFEDESRPDSTTSTVRQRNSNSLKSRLKQQLSNKPQLTRSSSEPAVSSSTLSRLTISPPDELVFSGTTTSSGEILQALTLTNNTTIALAFKVKTTSPESYRVRPSSGLVPPSSSVDINVYLQPGHAASVIRDKFLVMSAEVEEGKSATDLAALWKTLPKPDVVEHRLRCRFVPVSNQQLLNSDGPSDLHGTDFVRTVDSMKEIKQKLNDIEEKVDATNKKISFIEEGLQVFIKIQLVLLSALIVLFGIVFYYGTLR